MSKHDQSIGRTRVNDTYMYPDTECRMIFVSSYYGLRSYLFGYGKMLMVTAGRFESTMSSPRQDGTPFLARKKKERERKGEKKKRKERRIHKMPV